ncbi:hypothetical protein Poli38472_008672 [Pythium oligandrum]|uniref:Exocyst complex component Sec10 n=1 Tax=Pythium oligandrum TaxID=41045 RepID=A0A8K1FCP2_PYTOL|nr:hypothetical protein Poli38472_008672 [Pythium oligandrum]|eukprot:TMW56024.1 hypothetical protein Poli38472_008672 [Pythium oligandrum]
MPPITPSGAAHSPVVSLLLSQFILHDLITQVIAQCDRLSLLIEENEERETDLAYLAQVVPMPRRTSSSSLTSMSSQSSQSRPSSAKERESYRVPQVKKISIEFEDILAELKLELAGLTESVFENVELTAIRLCRPVMSKDNPKAKGSANEFVELLIQQLLEPLSLYIMETATISRAYIFPKIIERCIAVIIDEFVVDSARMNETVGKQLEKATTLLRAFCMHVETEYNTNNSAIVGAISEMGLQLLVLDGFKRIDLVLQLCLRNGKEHDSASHKIAFKANLESLKTSFKRSMTARSGNALSGGSATPPPQ